MGKRSLCTSLILCLALCYFSSPSSASEGACRLNQELTIEVVSIATARSEVESATLAEALAVRFTKMSETDYSSVDAATMDAIAMLLRLESEDVQMYAASSLGSLGVRATRVLPQLRAALAAQTTESQPIEEKAKLETSGAIAAILAAIYLIEGNTE